MNSAHAIKQLHAETIHTPVLRVLMRYSYEGKNHVQLVTLNQEGMTQISRTVKWAARKGIEIVLQPV